MIRLPPAAQGTATARDGTTLAYKSYGDATEPTLVLTNGFATSSFYWVHVIQHFAPKARVITWDLKGHGDSDPAGSLDACSVEDSVDDMRRILDAAGVESAVLLGFSMGCQIVLEAWRHIPSRIDAIAPILGTYGRPFDSLLHPAFGRVAARVFLHLGRYLGGLGLRATARLSRHGWSHRLNQLGGMIGEDVSRAQMAPFYAHLERIDPQTWVAMGNAAQAHTAEDLLPSIEVPVLVVSGGRDVMTPPAQSARMRSQIPNADALVLPEATHTGLYEFPEEINAALDAFLAAHELMREVEAA